LPDRERKEDFDWLLVMGILLFNLLEVLIKDLLMYSLESFS